MRHNPASADMFASQFGLLFLEGVVMATLVLGLFRARSVLGLSPLYIVMGGFQYPRGHPVGAGGGVAGPRHLSRAHR